MAIDYGVDEDVDKVEERVHQIDGEEELPDELENKLTLPDVNLNYTDMAKVWADYFVKVSDVDGWGAISFKNSVKQLGQHLRLAASHLEDVRNGLITLNSEKRERISKGMHTSAQRKVFTNFFNKLSDTSLYAQLALFKVPGMDEERDKEDVVNDLVNAAIAVNGGDA